MPTFTHGKNTRILANGYDVSGWLKTWNAKATADTADTSTIGSSAKSFIPGLKDGVFSVDGFADGTATGINAILVAMLGTSTVWTAVSQADAVGVSGFAATTIENDFEVNADVGSAVSIKGTGQTTGGMDAVLVLHNLQSEAAGGSATSIDNLAASSNGMHSYLHVTAVGTTLTVKVQDSADNVTFADLITHTAVTVANEAEEVSVSGTVRRYTKSLWTLTGAATFHHAAARL
jgi:hypothetical protein